MMKKIFHKYLVILLVYLVVVRFVGYYGLRLYYTSFDNPQQLPFTAESFQSLLTTITFLFNLFIVIVMLTDSRTKRMTEWLIFIITLFNAETGIVLFIVWTFYEDWVKKHEAQQQL
jgi:archaellum biogenesis protein FlaJ (TadC family)